VKHKTALLLTFIVVILALALTPQAQAQQGDCDADGLVNASDLTYLIDYLFAGGPAPNMTRCDCDNYPGVNYGDLWQLIDFLFVGATFYAPPGTDVPIPANVKFLAFGEPDGIGQTQSVILVDAAIAVDCVLLPYSFAAGPGEATLDCSGVDFTGSVGTNLSATIDNVGKTFIISNSLAPSVPSTTNWRVLATANFTQVAPGTPVTIKPTSTTTLFPMLLAQSSYNPPNGTRVIFPIMLFSLFDVGNVDCLNGTDIDDVVYMIRYIFQGGPAPGDPTGDGIPDC
jgi:hypothetical protein